MQFAPFFIASFIDIARIHSKYTFWSIAIILCLDPIELKFPVLFAIFSLLNQL